MQIVVLVRRVLKEYSTKEFTFWLRHLENSMQSKMLSSIFRLWHTNLLGRRAKSQNTISIICIPTEIRTRHLSNAKQNPTHAPRCLGVGYLRWSVPKKTYPGHAFGNTYVVKLIINRRTNLGSTTVMLNTLINEVHSYNVRMMPSHVTTRSHFTATFRSH